MSSAREKPPKLTGGADSREPANDSRSEPLFTNLFASRPPPQRRGIWIFAGLLHLPLILFFWFSDTGQSFRDAFEEVVRPILLIDDNPPPIALPVAPAPPKPADPPPVERAPLTRQEPATVAPLIPSTPTPGAAVTNTPTTTAPVAAGSLGGTLPSSGSLRERLSPPSADALLAPLPPIPGLSRLDASRGRLAERIKFYNDSVAYERLAEAEAMDWTIKGEDGKRWGVSPGKLHLGDITIPLGSSQFVPSPGQRDEVNKRMRMYATIEQQAIRQQIKDSFEDRVKEIRKRKDAERAEAKKKPVTNDRLP